jgi:hypothetical protein
MSNREVAGLQALAQKHGGQLSVNPDTGLPEAGFLDNLLPMVAGAGLTYFSGGAINPMMAAGIVGGISALDSKDLSKGLVAGLGAYGGAGMVGGLAGLGATSTGANEVAREAAVNSAIQNGTYQSSVGSGLSEFAAQPLDSLSTLGGGSAIKGSLPILEGLAPAAVEAFDEEDEGDGAPAQHKGYIRKYALDPVTGQYKQVGAYEAGGDPNVDVSSKAGTAGAFGGVGQSEYEAAQGMAEGGTATDSSRIYDYLMGRGPNPMQFTHTTSPQVDYNINKTPAPITPTTPILEEVYDPYGNRSGGSGGTAEQREQREKDWNAPQDYLSIDRVNPDGTISKDVQSNASLAAMSPSERAMHMADVRRINPIRTFVSDAVTKIGVLPILSNVYDHFAYGNLGRPLPPGMPRAPVSDVVGVSTPEFYAKEVEADLQRQQEATEQLRRNITPSDAAQDVRIAQFDAGRTHEGGGGGQGPTGPQSAASRSSDGPGQSGSGGWGRGATGGLATPYGIEHMAHGGIANLAQGYDSGGMTLSMKAQPIKNLGSMHPKSLQAAYDHAVATNDVAGARKYQNELGLREKFKSPQIYADGGETGEYNLGSYSDGGRLLKGPGDGVSDDIPATIGNGQPARLADGEFVIPARIVSELGNGSTDAGARALYKMMDRIQAGRRKTVGKDQVAKNSKSARHLPA